MSVMRAARRRWAIENETFETLEARNAYGFEHDFGHGRNHLADVFATFANLAFPMDQAQQHCCPPFRKARKHRQRNLHLRDRLRSLFRSFVVRDWRIPYLAMSGDMKKPELAELLSDGP